MRPIFTLLILLLSGCGTTGTTQRGGVATIGSAILAPFKWGAGKVTEAVKAPNAASPTALAAPDPKEGMSITPPDAPGQQSTQNAEHFKEEELVFSSPTSQTETSPSGVVKTTHIPAGSKLVVKESTKVGQVLGAGQKDTVKATASLLGSFKWVQGLGVLVLLIGAVGFAHPAARLLIGGKDTAMVVGLVGVGMIAGPFLLVQYADWFALGLLAAAGYWFWSRAKHKESTLDALQSAAPFPKNPPQ